MTPIISFLSGHFSKLKCCTIFDFWVGRFACYKDCRVIRTLQILHGNLCPKSFCISLQFERMILGGVDKTDYYRPQRSCEGYVFTRVCDSVHGGGVLSQHTLQGVSQQWGGACSGGVCSRGVSALAGACSRGVPTGGRGCGDPPQNKQLLLQTVRILLECILVNFCPQHVSFDGSAHQIHWFDSRF